MDLTQSGMKSAEELRREHAALQELLCEVRQALDELSGGALLKVLEEFHRVVDDHFQREEEDGVFDDAVSLAPRLSQRATALMRQHPALLTTVEELVEMARRDKEPREITERFEIFAKKWLNHESEENKLLQEAYCLDLGAMD